MEDQNRQKVKIECGECGGGSRNHEVVASHEESENNEYLGTWQSQIYQICKCCGCDTVRFRREIRSSENLDFMGEPEPSVSTYPELNPTARRPHCMEGLPDRVNGIYRETIAALNAGALTLAGGGLRAIVEAVCIDQRVDGKSLQQRIDELAVNGLLAKSQADLLHEERYIGNTALHEIERPAQRDIEDGLQIVESLLNTIYIAPMKAVRLKGRRLNRDATKSKPPGAGTE